VSSVRGTTTCGFFISYVCHSCVVTECHVQCLSTTDLRGRSARAGCFLAHPFNIGCRVPKIRGSTAFGACIFDSDVLIYDTYST
jgi:hypothetical protein